MAETLLAVGAEVPDVEVPNQDGEMVNLRNFKGEKLIVFFYPKDNSPSCTKEACSLRDHHQTFVDKGYKVFGVSPDSQKAHQNFINKQSLPYALLSDPDNALTKSFGAWGEKKMRGKAYMGLLRSTFVVNEEGMISHVVPKVNTKEHAEQLLELIES